MKINQCSYALLVLAMGCHAATKPATAPLKAMDTTNAVSHPGLAPDNDSTIILKTHLSDTTYAAGSFILFLEPNEARFVELEKEAEGDAGDADTDFGVGISNTWDSVKKNERYKDIKVLTSTSRYIYVKDCKDGPLIIDRDSVSYGFMLSAKGRPIAATYNSVHSGDYLGEIKEFFSLH